MRTGKIKVTHIITRLDPGGSSTNTVETVSRLDRKRYEILLIYGRTHDPDGLIEKDLAQRGIRYIRMDELVREPDPIKDIRAFWKMTGILREEKPDIVHTHSSKGGVIGRWSAFLAGVRVIVHTPHGHIFYGYFNRFETAVYMVAEKITSLITTRLITLTKKGKEEHIELGIISPARIVPIYSGIDIKYFSEFKADREGIRKALGFSGKKVIFGTVARLDPVKGNRYLIEAMGHIKNNVPDQALIIVGGGSEEKALMEMAEDEGIRNDVRFIGHVGDVRPYMAVMDIFVLASLNEGMGRALIEAMAMEKPVISTRTGGIPEVVSDGETGLLVEPADSAGLAREMQALALDPPRARILGARGRKKVTEVFGIDKMVDDIENLYGTLL
ncbi:MAG: glycosyltransferase family 4 protein [Candidatus Omnitrophica bacterium]|nr:glycosyltransferase family 4 protein [Candidatus Omnitrophota bacterium]